MRRQLPDRRRLARAVDAHDENHARVSSQRELPRLAEHPRDLFLQPGAEIAVSPGLQRLYKLRGGRDADVRGDQRLLEPLPGRLLGRVEAPQRELLGQGTAALPERLAQPREEPRAFA